MSDVVAICIGCGCDDNHACVDEGSREACHWLRLSREEGVGVCSCCSSHVERWDAGDRVAAIAATIKDKKVLLGRPCFLLDPRCKGQVAIAKELRPAGMRMVGVGIVPHDEYRPATWVEYDKWFERISQGVVEKTKKLRETLGLTPTEMGRLVFGGKGKAAYDSWNQWEGGHRKKLPAPADRLLDVFFILMDAKERKAKGANKALDLVISELLRKE